MNDNNTIYSMFKNKVNENPSYPAVRDAQRTLSRGELDALASDYARAAKIAEAAAEGAPTSIQDEELRRAAAATAIWGLSQPGPPSAVDLVRQFV